MNPNDLPNDIKVAILSQELEGIKQQIYRLSVSVEVRKLAGYTDDENKGLLLELERIVRVRDALSQKLNDLKGESVK